MLLNDIGNAPDIKIKKINQYLETNYGFKITENVSGKDLARIVEQIEGEITQLKIQGGDARESPEISKRLMILEGIRALREFALPGMGGPEMGVGIEPYHQSEFDKVVGNLVRFVIDSVRLGDKIEVAMDRAKSEYDSCRYRFPSDQVVSAVRHHCDEELGTGKPLPVDIAEDGDKWIQDAHVEKNKGGLHRALHVPQGQKIPSSKLNAATHSSNPHTAHMAQFAKNVKQESAMNPKDPHGVNVQPNPRDRSNRGAVPNADQNVLNQYDTAELDSAGLVPDSNAPKPGANWMTPSTSNRRRTEEDDTRFGATFHNPTPRTNSRTSSLKVGSTFQDKARGSDRMLNPQPLPPRVHPKSPEDREGEHWKTPSIRQGRQMNEQKGNLVKNLRALLETEVSQAEVMMAAKGFAQELQEMVEKIGRLQNEDLPPVTDQMRETYGMESASAFQTQIYGALQSVMDSLYTAKQQVDDAVGNMASTGQVDASVDMDKDIDMGLGGDDMGDADLDVDADLDLDNIGDELGAEAGLDDLGGDVPPEEEPLGREMKEAILKRKVMEMKKLVEKAKRLREAAH